MASSVWPLTFSSPEHVARATWETKRKYGERASSCASSAGSMDSRFSEDFGPLNTLGNTASPPLQSPSLGYTVLSRFSTPPRKKRREDSPEAPSEAESKPSSHRGQLPGPPNPLNAYFKIRRTIKEAFSRTSFPEPIDQCSSCASISLSGVDLPTSGEPTAKSINLGKLTSTRKHLLLFHMRAAVVRWQCRKLFFELTSDLQVDEQSTTHAWRRRRAVVDELLSTGSRGEEWAALVARRFTKTTARQIAGFRAILKLQVEEAKNHTSPGMMTKFDWSSQSYNLLKLISVQLGPVSLFEEVLPAVLRDWPTDKPDAIVWLARGVSPFMPCIDGGVMWRYGRQVIQNATPWTNEWMDGMWLLTALFRAQVAWIKDRSIILSVAKFILDIGMEALGNVTFDTLRKGPDEVTRLGILSLVVLTCLHSEESAFLPHIVPSARTLGPFAKACADAVCANGIMTCSALKALALLRNIPTTTEDIPPSKMAMLTACCLEIVLGRGNWKKTLLIEKCSAMPFPLIPEEDAFDVLCRIPQPHFPRALAAALTDCPISLDPSSQDHFNLFEMLEPLQWLSKMPDSIPEAHRVLVEGGAVDFLAQVILDSPRKTWVWEDRAVWRLKGDAITCLGSIIEKMDEADLQARIKDDVIKAVVEIKENQEAPLFQREQATVMLERYKATVDRCDIMPFCAEMLGKEPEGSKSAENLSVRVAAPVVPGP